MAKKIIYYDVETTGLKPDSDHIIEIAAYCPKTDAFFCQFVNPERSIPEAATNISGITNEMVANAPNFAIIGEKFLQFCSFPAILIAHNNAAFDQLFLAAECKKHKLTLPDFLYIDTYMWAKKYRPDLPKHSLAYLAEIYNVPFNESHRALNDAKTLHKIFSLMIENLPMEVVCKLLQTTLMPFGKYKGQHLQEIPKHYIRWLKENGIFDKPENQSLKNQFHSLGLLKEQEIVIS